MILRPLGFGYFGVEETEDGFTFLGKGGRRLDLSELAGSPSQTKVLGYQVATFPLKDGSEIKLAGLNGNEVAQLISSVTSALREFYAEAIDSSQGELQSLARVIARLKNPRRYPSACLLEPFLARAAALSAKLPDSIPWDALNKDSQLSLDAIRDFVTAPDKVREGAIERFMEYRVPISDLAKSMT